MSANNAEIITRITQLKKQRNAVILVHNYQRPEIQDIGDFVGDSLELSQKAATVQADVIVFCGVDFMAETAYIVNPKRTVLLPEPEAGCPMAQMITAEKLIEKKKELPDVAVVCYVNSSAAVKAESDICCTSANAVKVVQSLGDRDILFVPDQYLGQWVSQKTGKQMHLWPGFCPTHMRVLAEDILRLKKQYPGAVAVVHPECRPEAKAAADEVLSTGGMMRFARETKAKTIIIGTETGIIYRLQKENPDKKFIAVSDKVICPNMKRTTLEKVLWSLQEMEHRITVPEDIRQRALRAVQRMLDLG
ncbi:MAG TPA: quinolinate synthase NadA [Dehalococcoidales bacterium]|nr:quinolinate synthase NadA [Dehalococcoidales bacterium]